MTSYFKSVDGLGSDGGVGGGSPNVGLRVGASVHELVQLLRDRQVPIRYNAPVTLIRVEGGRARGVELTGGEFIPSDIMVGNSDAAWTCRHLIEPQHRKHWTDKRIAKCKYSWGLLVWHFGTDRQYPDVPHHMMVLGPRYKGLLQDIFKNHPRPRISAATFTAPRRQIHRSLQRAATASMCFRWYRAPAAAHIGRRSQNPIATQSPLFYRSPSCLI